MKIYISGRITGTNDYRERFQAAAEKIRNRGHEPVNPVKLDQILDPATTTWTQFMLASRGLLRACHGIYVLPGWEDSKGARLEHDEAIRCGRRIYKDIGCIQCVIWEEVKEAG